MNSLLKRFDEPHKKIHGVGVQVQELVAGGEHEQATRLIESTRQNVLSTMIRLFASLKEGVSEVQRDIAVVLTTAGKTFAVSVDAVISVEKLSPGKHRASTCAGRHGPG